MGQGCLWAEPIHRPLAKNAIVDHHLPPADPPGASSACPERLPSRKGRLSALCYRPGVTGAAAVGGRGWGQVGSVSTPLSAKCSRAAGTPVLGTSTAELSPSLQRHGIVAFCLKRESQQEWRSVPSGLCCPLQGSSFVGNRIQTRTEVTGHSETGTRVPVHLISVSS